MSNIWFTSDHHFGHKNILVFEPEARPFKTVEEMNETLIDRWNSVVRKGDIVYHLGDFAFGKHNICIAERLNGKKRLVLGNHDSYCNRSYLQYFEKLYGIKYWEKCILSHVPVHPNGLGQRWWVNVHGHLHSGRVMMPLSYFKEGILCTESTVIDPNYFNVSVECNNLAPVSADIIRDAARENT